MSLSKTGYFLVFVNMIPRMWQSLIVEIVAVIIVYPIIAYVIEGQIPWSRYAVFVLIYSAVAIAFRWWRLQQHRHE